MDSIDQKLLVEAEKGLFLTAEPFKEIANQIGITPQEVISRLQKLKEDGVIRRFGVSLMPSGIGYAANALVAWKVPENRVIEVAEIFSRRHEVSHCYERETAAGKWAFNIYMVMHAHERKSIETLVKQFSIETALKDYLILYSTKNLKTKPLETKKC
jgi:DNA-binding Lrp family transcriptional regulator